MPTDLDALVAQIMQSKKYRGVSEDTIRDILMTELARQNGGVVKVVSLASP